uniref:Expressed protein n=1 Tax=Echinococcus granulosus TaxID=6210 RepID=A0A068WXJ4_ECHGR|nr:expressed protein [Echinococcus granulosus]
MTMLSQQLLPPISPSISLRALPTPGDHHLSVPHGPTDHSRQEALSHYLPTYLNANASQRNSTVAEWN